MEAVVEVAKTSSNDDELNLNLGDVITNVVQIDNTLYEGQLHGKKGHFREEFVKLIVKDSSKPSLIDGESKVVRRDEKKRKAVKALYSYTPTNNDELELKVHDIIEVVEETEPFWWKGVLKGSIGMFPSNFVTEVNPELNNFTTLIGESALKQTGNRNSHIIPANVSASPPSQKEVKQKLTNSTCDDETTQSNSSSNEKRQYFQSSAVAKKTSVNPLCDAPQLPPKPVREQAKVLYLYEAQNEDELSLREGDIIMVISKEVEDKGWWRGELNNQIGVFPDNFVELIKSEEIVQKKPERPDKPVIRPMPNKGNSNLELQEKVATVIQATSKKTSKTPPAKPPPPEIHKKDEKPERPLLPHSVKKPQVPPPMKKPMRSSLGMRLPSSSSTSSASNSISSPITDSPPPLMSHTSPSAFSYKNTSQLLSPENSIKPPIANEAGDMKDTHEFDLLEVSTDKLLHVTANRVKFPNRRPPSHIFLKENEKENEVAEESKSLIKDLEEMQSKAKFQMKETQSKELRVCKPVPISSHEEKPKVPPYRPAFPAQIRASTTKTSKPEPSNVSQPPVPHIVQASIPHIPSSESSATKVAAKKVKEDVVDTPTEQNTFQLELSQLRNEMRTLKESMVPKTEYEKLISQVNMLKESLEMHKSQYKKQICSLKAELEEEKKFRLSMQKGFDK